MKNLMQNITFPRKEETIKKAHLFCFLVSSMLYLGILLFLFPIKVQAGHLITTSNNPYYQLSVPTQITKLGDTYYLVDCYHNQVLWSKEVGAKLTNWKVMAGGMKYPHAVATDGNIEMVLDTDNNRVITYRKTWEGFEQLQVFEQIGNRPHYVKYDSSTGRFYVWSSMNGEMYVFTDTVSCPTVDHQIAIEKVMSLPQLKDCYVRSFLMEGDTIYLPCVEQACIYAVDKTTFQIKKTYPVSDDIAGVVQLSHIQNYYYLTISTNRYYDQSYAGMVRAASLTDLAKGKYENLSGIFGPGGGPYYIESFDGGYFTVVPRDDGKSGMYSFQVVGDVIQNVKEYALQ